MAGLLDDIMSQLQTDAALEQAAAQDTGAQPKMTQEGGQQAGQATPAVPDDPQAQAGDIVVNGRKQDTERPSLFTKRVGDQIVDHAEAPTTASNLFNRLEDVAGRRAEQAEIMQEDLDRIHDDQTDLLKEKVTYTQKIIDDQVAASEELKAVTQPLFAERQNVAAKLERIRKGNPLIVGIKSIFDLNYNKDYQEGKQGMIDDQIRGVAAQFDHYDKINEKLVNLATQKYINANSVLDLELTQSDQNWTALGRVMQTRLEDIEAFGKQQETNSAMASARILARNEVLDQLDEGQAAKLLSRASANGGSVDINGVTLSEGQLREQRQKRQRESLAVESARLAVANAKIENSNAALRHSLLAKDAAVESMTRSTIQTLVANNGLDPKTGIQYDISKLVQKNNAFRARDEQMVQGTELANSYGRYQLFARQSAAGVSQIMKLASSKASEDPTLNRLGNQYVTAMQLANGRIQQAFKKGGDTAMQAQAAKEAEGLQAAYVAYQKQVSEFATRLAGDEKTGKAFYNYWTSGEMQAGEARDVLIRIGTTGQIPAAMRSSPAGQQVINRAKALGEEVRAEYRRAGKTPTAKQMQDGIAARLDTQELGDIAASQAVDSIVGRAPEIARQIGHPFGRISDDAFKGAVSASTSEALEAVGKSHGMSGKQVEAILNNTTPMDANAKNAIRNEVARAQQSYMLTNLDKLSPNTSSTFKPSAEFVRLMNSSQFQNVANNYEQGMSRIGFGDYLAYQATGGNIATAMGQQAGQYKNAYGQMVANQMKARMGILESYSDPYKRTDVILAAADMNQHDRQALLAEIKRQAPERTQLSAGGKVALPDQGRTSDRIDAIILNSRFEDPGLEKVRQRAAAGYIEAKAASDRAFGVFGED